MNPNPAEQNLKKIPFEELKKTTTKILLVIKKKKKKILPIFFHFSVFSSNISLLDPDRGGKMNADPDPQLC